MKTRRRAMQQPPPGRLWKKNRAGWQCPGCGKTFIQRGLWHSCGAYTLADHFRGRPRARKLFEAFRAFVKDAGGPFRLSIAKTRIGFIRGITFSGAIVRKDYLRSGFLLLRRLRSPRFVKVEHFPPYYVHYVEIRDASDLDDELRAWAREAYAVGKGKDRTALKGRPRSRAKVTSGLQTDLQVVREALAELEAGDPGVPLDEAFNIVRKKHGLPCE